MIYILSILKILNSGYGKDKFCIHLREVIHEFNMRSAKWTNCFRQIVYHDSKIAPNYDIYNPGAYNTDPHWVNGPNRQF